MARHTLLDSNDRVSLLVRFGNLRSNTAPQWGRMNAGQMVHHCVEALRASLGDTTQQPLGRKLFHTRLVKYFVFRVLPFPRNAPTAPELVVERPTDLDHERLGLAPLVDRYGVTPVEDRRVEHPLFGRLTREEWGELEYKHLDHHLRQFGL